MFRKWDSLAGVALVVVLVWSGGVVWPYAVGVLCIGVLGGAGWWLPRAHRAARDGDRAWRATEERNAREVSIAAVDAMSWQEFEEHVVGLCRRDGCTDVVVSGRKGGPQRGRQRCQRKTQ